jgi:ketol-acid reductoisomerase
VIRGKILFDADIDVSILKDIRIGLIGYGSQGRAQALNLRDSGFTPLVGVREGRSGEQARKDGFETVTPRHVSENSDFVLILTPDETHAAVCSGEVFPYGTRGAIIGFAAGFTIHYGLVSVPQEFRPVLVAPKGPGRVLRQRFEAGSGIPALVAAGDGDLEGLGIAVAYAKAIGCARMGVVRTTFEEEAVADLFGEQCVLVGGLVELMKAAFTTLVERGYSPEVAYIECISEVEYMASVISRVGLSRLGEHISSTAFYGGISRGPRVIDASVRDRLQLILDEIESGGFYEEFRNYARSAGVRVPGSAELERIEKTRGLFKDGRSR